MNKTILCAIDFSESSVQGLKWALNMAQATDAEVTVLFCYRLIAGEDEQTLDLKKTMETNALEKFSEIEKRLVHHHPVSYRFVSEVGFFPFRIETFIRKSPVGLLVIGNSIVQDFNEYKNLNFDQFLRTTKVPVVIVPEGIRDNSGQNQFWTN